LVGPVATRDSFPRSGDKTFWAHRGLIEELL